MVATTSQVGSLLFNALRAMDQHANAIVNGCHAGLCDYAAHVGIKTKRYEVPIYRAIARHLSNAGTKTTTDVDYPTNTGQECDLVVEVSDRPPFWIEFKMAWKAWFSSKTRKIERSDFYRSYLLGPRSEGLPRTHSVCQDFEKLMQLTVLPSVGAVGVLLLGFEEAEQPMEPELARMQQMACLDSGGWQTEGPAKWADTNDASCMRACWFWWRS